MQELPQIYRSDRLLGYRYRPGAEGRICIPSIEKTVRINRNGYYGPSFERAKAEGSYRIAVVGCSNSTGIWLDGERSFPLVLEEQLRARCPRVEVLNFSVDGRSRDAPMIRQIKGEVLDYRPDLVLFCVDLPLSRHYYGRESYRGYLYTAGHSGLSPEDTEWMRTETRRCIDEIEARPSRWLYRASYLVRAFVRWRMLAAGGGDRSPLRLFASARSIAAGRMVRRPEPRQPSWIEAMTVYQRKRLYQALPVAFLDYGPSVERLQQLSDKVRERGAELVLVQYAADPEQDRWLAGSGLERVVVGLDPDDTALRHRHDGHYSERGHARIAAALFDALVERLPQ